MRIAKLHKYQNPIDVSPQNIEQDLLNLVRGVNNIDSENFRNEPFKNDYTTTWAGTLGAPALNDGTLLYRYIDHGPLTYFGIYLQIGPATVIAGTGAWSFSLKRTSSNFTVRFSNPTGFMLDASAGLKYPISAEIPNNSTTLPLYHLVSPVVPITPIVPVAWAVGDELWISGFYERKF